MQKSAQATHPNAAPLKGHLISTLNALKKVPGQKKNAESMLNAIKAGKIPNAQKPVLYAIGDIARLAKVADYAKDLQCKLKQNPEVEYHYYCWNSQLMANTKPTPPPAPSTQAQLAQYAFFEKSQLAPYVHEIMVEFRCPALFGGSENVIRRSGTINDTGSNVQSIHRSDWNALKSPGMAPQPGEVLSATGSGRVENVFLDVRIVKPGVTQNPQGQQVRRYVPLTKWYMETLILVNDGQMLLSCETMREYLYFATAPGNERLLVSQRKQAIIQGLDVRQPDLP